MSVGYNAFEWYEYDLDEEYRKEFLMSLEEKLEQFIGSTKFYRLTLMPILCTEGVKYFAEEGNAYWAVSDIITEACLNRKLKGIDFIAIEIRSKDGKAEIIYEDGNCSEIMCQKYDFTDLEEGTYNFFLTDKTLLLRSEY